MVDSPFKDLVEYNGPAPWQDLKAVPLDRLRNQHNKHWTLHTTVGDLVLKKIGQLAMDRITTELLEDFPEYRDLMMRAHEFSEYEKLGAPLGPQEQTERDSVYRRLVPYQNLYAKACIVGYRCKRCRGTGRVRDPSVDCPDCRGTGRGSEEYDLLETTDDLDALLSSLQRQEVNKLYPILRELISDKPPGEVNDLVLVLCKEFNVPFAQDLTATNMTAEQAYVLRKSVEVEAQAVEQRLEDLKHAKS